MSDVGVVAAGPGCEALAKSSAKRWHLPLLTAPQNGLVLVQTPERLELRQLDEPKLGAVFVDFGSDALTYRRTQGGGRKEAIAKAAGVKGDNLPRVLDATAGLGRDAFVLAAIGCTVDMIERSAVVAALLNDGLERAATNADIGDWIGERMHLSQGISFELMQQWQRPTPEVVYLDPMFPHRQKSALVKKEMRLFQQLLGPDPDADKLLEPALALATQRVVVKRPSAAPWLDARKPSMAIESKKHRFDVYITKA